MRRVLGIISEYNPFHNGHLYHLMKSKQITNSDYTIAVISGNFTQRGSTSIVDKWSKAEMALLSGVDLVLELPTVYSISSAENFAEGAIKTLDSLGIVTDISFGAEVPNVYFLDKFASVLYEEPKEYKNILAHELNKGLSYPKARENALMMYLNDIRRFANVLSSPNNILGIEYLKALKKFKSPINPISIQRVNCGYNDIDFSGDIASATAIRNLIINDDIKSLRATIPDSSYSVLLRNIENGQIVPDLCCFDKEIIYTLRRMSVEEIADLPDVSEGLEFAIKKAASSCNTTEELINIVISKRYTKTRIQRILLYALLGITEKDMELSKKTVPYVRVLGFNNKGKSLISEISHYNPKLPIIGSVKKFMDNSNNKNLKMMLEKDIWATDVYTLGYENNSYSNLDYTQKMINI